jgi:putative oxidoreductase
MSPGKPRFGGVFCVLHPLLWAAILLFFVIRSGNRHSVDARAGKAF